MHAHSNQGGSEQISSATPPQATSREPRADAPNPTKTQKSKEAQKTGTKDASKEA
jgi:hypothetical protein